MREKLIQKLKAVSNQKLKVAAELNALIGEERLLSHLIREIEQERIESSMKIAKEVKEEIIEEVKQ